MRGCAGKPMRKAARGCAGKPRRRKPARGCAFAKRLRRMGTAFKALRALGG